MTNLLKQKKLLIIAIMVLFIGILVFLGLQLMNKEYLYLNVQDGDVISYEYGTPLKSMDIEALCKGTILNKRGTPVEYDIKGDVDYTVLGKYQAQVIVSYKDMHKTANITISVEDTLPPVIELVSNPNHYTNPTAQYEEEGYVARDSHDGMLTDQVIREEKDGVVIYTVTDSSGNTATVERVIIYKDVIAPVIQLKGENQVHLNYGDDYEEIGYTAIDECDGDISKSVTVEGSVDSKQYGEYTLVYKVKDASGNEGTVIRKVIVADISVPKLTLKGEVEMYIPLGGTFEEPGYTALDNADGDITSKVKVKGTVNTDKKGLHSITYTVKDSFGNETSVTRKVYVYDRQSNSGTVNPGDKVIYLTFDDGPSQFTKPLLEILDTYGVKATFFVSGQSSKYRDVIGEIYRSGHTVGLHTYSHKYNEIYSSTDAYYKDLELIHDIVYEQTGEEPWLIRFPGGTGNSISKRYCSGIMTSISQGVSYQGYLFCDWNVDSQDAIGTYSRSEIASNVINQIKGKNIAYVLQHDLYEESVEAVEEIICWGLSNGYTFLPLEKDSPMIHQTLKN